MSSYKYRKADIYITFNNNGDTELKPIRYKLPSPPEESLIDGYGLPPSEQYWQPKPIPKKLRELHNDTRPHPSTKKYPKSDLQKVAILENNQNYYSEEIKFIFQEWDRIENGYWFYNNGKPTFITGDHYFFLQYWCTDKGRNPTFRMRDRKFWLFVKMCDEDPLCYGFNFPKHRREGASTRVTCKRYLVAIQNPNCRVGLQSKDDNHASDIHITLLMDVFRYRLPFWLRPVWEQDSNNRSEIRFYDPRGSEHPDFGKPCLRSIMDFRHSGKNAYDGLKLKFLHNDEIAKIPAIDVAARWQVQRQCLSDKEKIGKAINTSTVEEMETGGGEAFYDICKESHYEDRSETGYTTSGLYNFFMPAYEGFSEPMPPEWRKRYNADDWIDKYGHDVIDPITKRPAADLFIEHTIQSFYDKDNIVGAIEQIRMFPRSWKDCFKRKAHTYNFNIAIIEERLEYYRRSNPHKQRGNFMWVNATPDSLVRWQPDENGKFYISYQFADTTQANKFFLKDGIKHPSNTTKFIAGGDPYKFKSTKDKKKSKGAGAVLQMYDAAIDGNKDVSQWITPRLVCTYLARPSDPDIYGEDMIMMCHYFGCKIYPEINIESLWTYFIRRGYGSYLFFPVDKGTGKIAVAPGEQTSEKTKEAIFRETQYYIQHYGHREVHDEWLEQCYAIEDDMTDYDLFTAVGFAMIGAKRDSFVAQEKTVPDLSNIIQMYEYV